MGKNKSSEKDSDDLGNFIRFNSFRYTKDGNEVRGQTGHLTEL